MVTRPARSHSASTGMGKTVIAVLVVAVLVLRLPDVSQANFGIDGLGIKPPEILAGPENLTLDVGQKANITCLFRSYFNYVFMLHDGVPLNNKVIRQFMGDKESSKLQQIVYQLPHASLSDAGEYTCQALHGGDSRFIKVSGYVEVEGTEVGAIRNQTVRLGAVVELVCQVWGRPPPTVQWKTPGLYPGERVVTVPLVDGRAAFRFIATTFKHRGWYTCIVQNLKGKVEQVAYVNVKRPTTSAIGPVVTWQPCQPSSNVSCTGTSKKKSRIGLETLLIVGATCVAVLLMCFMLTFVILQRKNRR